MFAFHIPRHMTKWRGTGNLRNSYRRAPCNGLTYQRSFSVRQTGPCNAQTRPMISLQKSLGTTRKAYTTEAFKNFAADNPILLREICHCERCVDPSTQQRDFRYADIPTDIAVSSIEVDPESKTWQVRWKNDISRDDDHVSVFPQSKLVQLLDGAPAGLDVHRDVTLWDKNTFTEETKEVDYHQMLADDKELSTALGLIQRHGLVFVTNIPEDEEAVTNMVTRLTGLYRNTFYGQTWDVRSVPQAKNVAYTSKYLGFHMDLLYMKEPPGLQLLHCLQNSCSGGESEFADTFKAVDVLRQECPRYIDRLVKSKIRYGYNNDGHFYSDDKPVIKVGNRKHTPSPRIQGAADPDFMDTVEAVYWSPPFINSIAHSAHDGDIKEFIDASKAFAETLERPELVYETKLPAGTCAVFDNLRVVHARKAFDMNSGKRWLKGIYGDRQDLLSKSLKHVWTR